MIGFVLLFLTQEEVWKYLAGAGLLLVLQSRWAENPVVPVSGVYFEEIPLPLLMNQENTEPSPPEPVQNGADTLAVAAAAAAAVAPLATTALRGMSVVGAPRLDVALVNIHSPGFVQQNVIHQAAAVFANVVFGTKLPSFDTDEKFWRSSLMDTFRRYKGTYTHKYVNKVPRKTISFIDSGWNAFMTPFIEWIMPLSINSNTLVSNVTNSFVSTVTVTRGWWYFGYEFQTRVHPYEHLYLSRTVEGPFIATYIYQRVSARKVPGFIYNQSEVDVRLIIKSQFFPDRDASYRWMNTIREGNYADDSARI